MTMTIDRAGTAVFRVLPSLSLCVALAGCMIPVHDSRPSHGSASSPDTPAATVSARPTFAAEQGQLHEADPVAAESDPAASAARTEPEIHFGSGQFTAAVDGARRALPDDGPREVTLNFDQASLEHVVETILGEILAQPYLISPGVGGVVSFSTAEPLSRRALLPVLEVLLAVNDAALVHTGDFYRVVPRQLAPEMSTPSIEPAAQSAGYQVRVLRPRHLAASELARLLEPFTQPDSVLSVDEARNLLIVGGSAAEIHNYTETMRIFDVSWLEGMSIGLFPLSEVDPEVLVDELNNVFGHVMDGPLGNIVRFLPIERLGAVMVIAVEAEYLERAGTWIQRLDRSVGDAQERRLFVYNVQNVKAVDLAPILAELFADDDDSGATSRRSAPLGDPGVAPGLQPMALEDDDFQAARAPARDRDASPAESTVALIGGQPIRITAVEESNALLIRATAPQYDSVLEALKHLDAIPLQVMIEARIVEVTLNDQLSFGVQWFVESSRGDRSSELTFGTPVPGIDGSSLSWNMVRNNVEGFLRALESMTTLNVLSSPTLVVLNNREAQINVGDQVPVVTTSIQPTAGQTDAIRSVEFRDTGVILTVTPRVNPGGLVYLDISQEVSDPGEIEPTSGNRTILRRTVNTEVAVHSGETTILGGLIRENRSSGQTGVPILGRMPLIGPLFSQRNRDLRRTELLVMIRPTVIDNRDTAREVLRDYRRGFREIEPLHMEF